MVQRTLVNMKIEKFALQYLDDVANIEKVCFAHPWSRQDLKNQLDLDTSHFVVAVVDGRAVGYMGLQIFSGEGYVTNVAVLPEYRGRGLHRLLLRSK